MTEHLKAHRLRSLLADWEDRHGEVEAMLFDLDGTLVDTMDLHYEAYRRVFAEFDRHFDRAAYMAAVGPPALRIIPGFLRQLHLEGDVEPADIHHRKKMRFEEVLGEDMPRRLATFEILEERRGRASTAIVTSGNARGVGTLLAALGLDRMVDTVVTAEDVRSGKPDPEPFALGLARLGRPPARAIAFEDQALGIMSATQAGIATVDVDGEVLVAARPNHGGAPA